VTSGGEGRKDGKVGEIRLVLRRGTGDLARALRKKASLEVKGRGKNDLNRSKIVEGLLRKVRH